MTQPRPNADQVRRRFSASAVASALVVEFSGAGVCLGATAGYTGSRGTGEVRPRGKPRCHRLQSAESRHR